MSILNSFLTIKNYDCNKGLSNNKHEFQCCLTACFKQPLITSCFGKVSSLLRLNPNC